MPRVDGGAFDGLYAGQNAGEDELRAFCRDKIATFKIPKSIAIWQELPKGPTGKIQKRSIIEHYAAPRAD